LTIVVIYDNTRLWAIRDRHGGAPENTTRFMDQGGVEGVRDLPRSRTLDFVDRAHDRGRRGQSRYREAHAQHGVRSLRDRAGFKRDAFRVIYAVQLADEIWVVHAFQKKSTQGVKTPQHEIDLIKDRLKSLKERLR
jgi:phage-related protein